MAGFGGFGSTNNNANNSNPFGAPPAPPAGPFGGGISAPVAPFGGTPSGPFGSPPAAATMGGSFAPPFGTPAPNNNMMMTMDPLRPPPAATTGGGFGSSPFGTAQQQISTPTSTNNPFGGSPFGGNQNNRISAPSFGSNNAAPNNPFGGGGFASPAPPVPSLGTAQPAPSWQPPVSSSFGNTGGGNPSVPNPFAGTSATSTNTNNNPFAAVTRSGPPAVTPFGPQSSASTSGSAFGSSLFSSQSNAAVNTNPFGTAPTPTAASTATTNGMDSDMDGGDNGGSFGPFSQPTSSNNPFAPPTSTSSTAPFGQQTSSIGPFGSAPSASPSNISNPFGSTSEQQNKNKSKAPRSDLPFGTPHGNRNSIGTSFQPQHTHTRVDEGGSNDDDEEKKKRLALIEKKKKRLEELKKKKAAVAERGTSPVPPSLNASASPFVPATSTQPTAIPKSDTTSEASSLAERNAARFDRTAANSETRAHLPSDLQDKVGQAIDYEKLRTGGGGDRAVFDQAKSLVGTCPHMCPDEELLRREREGDIQLLELVRPGELHPANWTLRDTTIKRFRRSAADYKLDVPEWVRPPDVLEKVCSYLEEWIMERDRQGVDPRFKKTPPPLDVYQFIWDRTRMIRKDFTLQNYVGTGGNCDARAVRCHERIARWHAMCEHQLSHINDFVVMQSQQNIQELGQTMKTLNQFYDDALQRSLVEVPDDAGNETRTDLSGYAHGCSNDSVQGSTPTDYDGVALNNSPIGTRLVGKEGINHFHHGTAEPEMRGLYILLTIDNDGGMEVMRYAADLSRERPEIFQSAPVQLALQVYKAKKECNYARFFRILRSSSTPYLFGCIMFKYVPQMRKLAIEIMSKTFGGKNRETNETLYDAYPLKDLVRTLCFEDEEEAAAACRHYNITVKETRVKSSSGVVGTAQMIFWRAADFAEPKDPEKGFPIPLRPKKMVSTIERKRQSATRLAVCRGDVSGKGAFLNGDGAVENVNFNDLLQRQRMALAAMQNDQEEQAAATKVSEKKRMEEEAHKRKETERQELARLKAEEDRIKREKLEEAKRQEKEREIARAKAMEEDRRRRLEEQRIELERKRAEEERLRKLEEERKRRDEEAAEQERLHLLEERLKEEERRKAEEERKKREAELERLRKEEETRQRELALIKEAERIAKEEKERQLSKEWNEKVIRARKFLTLARWKRKMPKRIEMYEESKESLAQLKEAPIPLTALRMSLDFDRASRRVDYSSTIVLGLRSVIDDLLKRNERFRIDFECVRTLPENQVLPHFGETHVFLVKVAVLFPESVDDRYVNLCALTHRFANSRLGFGVVHSVQSPRTKKETRVVFVDGNNPENRDSCDGVLIVIPSGDGGIPPDAFDSFSTLTDSMPRAAVLLSQTIDSDEECEKIHAALAKNFEDVPLDRNTALSTESVSNSLLSSIEAILGEVAKNSLPTVEQVPVDRIAMLCLNRVIWLDCILNSRDGLLESTKEALSVLVDVLDSFGTTGKQEWNWPSQEFVSGGTGVPDYFGNCQALPENWQDSLLRENVGSFVQEFAFRLDGPFPRVISKLLADAPEEVIGECQEMFERRMFRRCLQRALIWRVDNQEPWDATYYVYLPSALLERVIARTVDALEVAQTSDREKTWTVTSMEHEDVASESIPAPVLTPQQYSAQNIDDEGPPEPIMDAPPTSRKRVPTGREQQQQQQSKSVRPSKRLRESRDFTRRLEALASGESVPPVFVGGQPLALLMRGIPPPMDPATFRTRRRSPVEEIS